MSINLTRLDFTSTINAMLCVAARHAVSADGARQRALDEIAASLNSVAAIIARHKLAEQLNGPIPPVPPRDQPGEDDGDDDDVLSLDDEPELQASAPQRARSPRSIFPDLTIEGHAPKLSPSQTVILDYIRANPGCTGAEISAATGYGIASVQTTISVIRKVTPIHSARSGGKNGTSSYRVDGGPTL